MEYKIWINVEQYDEAIDEYFDIDVPWASSGTFENEDDAIDFAQILANIAGVLA